MIGNAQVGRPHQQARKADVRIGGAQHWMPSSLRLPVAPVAAVVPVGKTRSASPIGTFTDVSGQTGVPGTSRRPCRSAARAIQRP
jgi:hypothetical protein